MGHCYDNPAKKHPFLTCSQGKTFYFFILLASLMCWNLLAALPVQAQQYGQPYGSPYPNNNQITTNQNAPRQEIARLEILVVRDDKVLPLALVPQVKKGDVLKVRLLDEAVSGIKIDQTQWDWTLVAAFANPLVNKQKQETAAQEIRFRKTGWYKYYSFTVPYDSQPVFFLSPRGNFRGQIMKAMSKNYGELQKIGEKMVEISGAYAQISTFLNELQAVINQNQYGSNGYNNYGSGNYGANGYGSYGNNYNQFQNNPYSYGSNGYNNYGNNPNPYWLDRAVERLARSFNIQMPDCWRATNFNNAGGSGSFNGYNNYNSYGNNAAGNYGSYGNYGNYGGGYQNNPGGFNLSDFVARSQCVAKTVRIEDFDVSITRMWQQGGVFFAAELQKKYPQLAYYINIAAAAIDFIVKVFQKSPLRIVPAMIASTDNQYGYQNGYQSNYQMNTNNGGYVGVSAYAQQNGQSGGNTSGQPTVASARISVFSSQQPTDQGFLTAYPIVVHKWQSNSDLEVASLYPAVLSDSCLHAGINLLKSTSLGDDNDTYTRDFKLLITSINGFRREFPLRRSAGFGGWELNLTPQDLAQMPKVAMILEGQIVGLRGFGEVSSPKFKLPVAGGAQWEISADSRRDFAVGGRHRIVLKNNSGDCRCVQSVIYKPSFGGQFEFTAGSSENGLQISPDGREVWFEVDSTNFQPGQGMLEIKTYGSEPASLNLKLYPQIPRLTNLITAYGDREIKVSGERLDQLKFVVIGGFRASLQPTSLPADPLNPQITTKVFVFDDPQARINAKSISLNLGLEDDRQYPYPQVFGIQPSRPAIRADEKNEIEAISDASLTYENQNRVPSTNPLNFQLVNQKAAVFPMTTKVLTLNIQNILNDYEFKNENLKVETRVEKSTGQTGDYLKTEFEVLDWKTLRLKLFFYGDIYTHLGGRRIQVRIRDSERGDSDWYTIKQTFVRIPRITEVKCTAEMDGMCEIKGDNIEYIAKVSVDGGRTWYPDDSDALESLPTADGATVARIPQLVQKNLLQIKLRDFPRDTGIAVSEIVFINKSPLGGRKAGAVGKSSPKESLKTKTGEMPPATGGNVVSNPLPTTSGNVVTNQNVNSSGTQPNNSKLVLPASNRAKPQNPVNSGALQIVDEMIVGLDKP